MGGTGRAPRRTWTRMPLGATADAFACNCGLVAVPGLRAEQLGATEDGKAVVP